MKQLHIFKTGNHTAMNGLSLEYSEAMIRACAAAYDPAVYEAPMVVGHPSADAPAYGWVKSLSASGANLLAEPQQVDVQFAELVDAGRYKKISASFYLPDSPNNPKPGVLYLRHVGFLGAQPPAIKGLKPVEFGEAEEGVVEFSDWGITTTATIFSRLRDFLISKFSLDEADTVLPAWQIDALKEAANSNDDSLSTAFSEPGVNSPAKTTQEPDVDKETQQRIEQENADLKRQLAERDASELKKVTETRNATNVAFAEKLVTEARLAPVAKNVVVALLNAVDSGNEPVEFSEGSTKKPLSEAFKELLSQAKPVVDFGEVARKDRLSDGNSSTVNDGLVGFAESDLDAERLAIHRKATALAAKENISYDAALGRCV